MINEEMKADLREGLDQVSGKETDKSSLMTAGEYIDHVKSLAPEFVIGRIQSKLAYQYLATIAKDLPDEMPVKQLAKVSGQRLLDNGMKDYQGKPLVPGLFYTVYETQIKKINHLKRLKRAYKKLGGKGVFIYGLNQFNPEFWPEWREVVNETFKEQIPMLQEEETIEQLKKAREEAQDKLEAVKEEAVEDGAEQVQG